MRTSKKWISILLICLMVLPYPVYATDIGPSGTCGENLTWTLALDGTLTISGTGPMTDFGPSYAENVSVPWNRADIKALILEEGVTSIGNNAFHPCANLTSVSLPTTLTRIGDHAFENCLTLTGVSIPSGVTEIGESAFAGCSVLTSISIPSGVTAISDYCFESCVALTDVRIPDSVTSIGRNAFKYCPALNSIVIPASVTSIGRTAFEECENLGHILYTGTQEQWGNVTIRYGAIGSNVNITYGYVDGMEYHVFESDCATKCQHCGYTRNAGHTWDEGISEGNTITYTCAVCGETRVDGTTCVPTEPTQPTESSTPATEPSVPPAAFPAEGDPVQDIQKPNGIGLWMSIVVAAIVVVIGIVLIGLKKKK